MPQELKKSSWPFSGVFVTKFKKSLKPTRPDERAKPGGKLRKEIIMNERIKTPEDVRQAVRSGYGQIAKTGVSCCGPASSCCGTSSTPVAAEELARHIGYSVEELAALPDG